MTGFRSRNAYYLRVSANVVLPLFLYLDERHVTWMSDLVLQHVLADLRPLIIPKLQAERSIHFGPLGAGNKRGTVEVHRGETYQFAYFFRKTEPHTVLLKSRCFVTAPVRPEVAPKSASPRFTDQNPQKKRLRPQVSSRQNKRKRIEGNKGKKKISQSHLGEDQWSVEDAEDEADMDDADPIPRVPLPVRRQRRIATQDDSDDYVEDMDLDDSMDSPPFETDAGSSRDPGVDGDDQPNFAPDMAGIELVVEEEEEKPKPFLKLKYRSFSITGHCLCVVVEPWPSPRAENRQQSVGLETPGQRRSLQPSLFPSNESIVARQRAKTPLFFPEYDRAPSETPWERESTLPPVPLFNDAVSRTENDSHSDDDLMNFSQTLNPAGHMYALTADDDDMDGAVLFGDADEVRELF